MIATVLSKLYAQILEQCLQEVGRMYERFLKEEVSEDCFFKCYEMDKIDVEMKENILELKDLRTAKLWIQYIEMIDILRSKQKGLEIGPFICKPSGKCFLFSQHLVTTSTPNQFAFTCK